MRDEGATIIFSTHNMASVEEICDEISLINKSKVILQGKVSDIKNQYRTSVYEVEYQPYEHSIVEKLPPDCKVSEKKETQFGRQIRVSLSDASRTNTLLNFLMDNARIIRFQEVVPSMNDIFIKMVNNASK